MTFKIKMNSFFVPFPVLLPFHQGFHSPSIKPWFMSVTRGQQTCSITSNETLIPPRLCFHNVPTAKQRRTERSPINPLRSPSTDITYSDCPVPRLLLAVHWYTPPSLRRRGRSNTRRSPTAAVPSGKAPPSLRVDSRGTCQ